MKLDKVEQLIQLFDTPMLVLDATGKLLNANSAIAQLGFTRESAKGRSLQDILGLDRATEALLLREPLEGEGGTGEAHALQITLGAFPDRLSKVIRRQVPKDDGTSVLVLAVDMMRDAELIYRNALAGAPLIFFEAQVDGRVMYGRDQLSDVLGIKEVALEKKPLVDFVHDTDKDRFRHHWSRILEGKSVRGGEFKLVGHLNSERPFWISLFPAQGRRGSVVGVRGVGANLSEQKSLAYALEAAEERFSVVFRESSDPIVLLSMHGDILSANPSFEEITGIRSDQLFTGEKSWSDIIASEDHEAVLACVKSCAEHQQDETVECRMNCAGQSLWYEQSYSILHDEQGQPRGMMGVARNIDRRKHQERALREHARDMQRRQLQTEGLIDRLKHFFSASSLLPMEREGYLPGVCNVLFGMFQPALIYIELQDEQDSPLVILGRPEVEAALSKHELRDHISGMSLDVGRSVTPLVMHQLNESKEYAEDALVKKLKLVSFAGAPLRDSSGAFHGTVSLFDGADRIFESVDVELITVAALQIASRLRADKQETVKHELEEHLRQSQKMEAVGLLAGGIAHDFNNILSGILGFSSYLKTKVEPGGVIHRDLGLIEQSALQASDLTRQLLAFARRKHFAKKPLNLNELIEEVLGIVRHTISKQIAVKLDLSSADPIVQGDESQLNQVLMNLCINAADAIGDKNGEIRLTTEIRPLTAREELVMSNLKKGEYVVLSIADSGSGMSPEVQKHIFDPFFTTKSDAGTGLGLSIVYGNVTNHGGDISVDSEIGKGTTFTMYFPALKEGAMIPEEEEEVLDVTGDETVLVVEDETIVRQMVTEVLKGSGYQVLSASGGSEAMEILSELQERVDLVFLDMVMPEMDGETTFHALREVCADVQILLTSGFTQEGRVDRLMAVGALGIVYKPCKSEELLSRIRLALNQTQKSPSST